MAKGNEMVASNDILAAAQARLSQLQSEISSVNKVIAAMTGEQPAAKPSTASSTRGRPKGSKNKSPKTAKPKAKAARKTASTGRRGRPKGSKNKSSGLSLTHAVARVLAEANDPMTVAQIVDAVGKLGYTTKAASFNVMVSQTLGKLSEVNAAESVKRGVWQSLKGIEAVLNSYTSNDSDEATTDATDNEDMASIQATLNG